MINTLLFDLDGTLLPIDIDIFMKHYFEALCLKCKSILEPEALTKSVLKSTNYMINNREKNKTNMSAFMEDFKSRINVELDDILPILDEFYSKEFDDLKSISKPNKIVKDIVEILRTKGYKMVIATNPLFPRQAILHRIKWAGLNPEDFTLITDYETMHFCKPNVEYYEEILSIIEIKPQNCIMVGNDVQEDLIATKLGIQTFLVTDYMINRELDEPKSDYKGNYSELLKFVIDLPVLKKE